MSKRMSGETNQSECGMFSMFIPARSSAVRENHPPWQRSRTNMKIGFTHARCALGYRESGGVRTQVRIKKDSFTKGIRK